MRYLKTLVGTIALVALASVGQAQVMDQKVLTRDGAKTVMAAALAAAKMKNAPGGAIAVSGAASAQQDEELAMAGASALQMAGEPPQASHTGDVIYMESGKVAAAFAKGAPLLEVGAYKIHASHRTTPGVAEIHERDTDIIYVLDGTATFVTGGTAVDAKLVAPEEIRGKAIAGGQSYNLVKGDVIVVPNGVPHWFQEVQAPFIYYVVKVRATQGEG